MNEKTSSGSGDEIPCLSSLPESESDVEGPEAGAPADSPLRPSRPLFSDFFERVLEGECLRFEAGTEGRASLEILFDSSPDCLLTLSSAGRIEAANPAFCRIFGYEQAELLGFPIDLILPECYRSGFRESLTRALEGGGRSGPEGVIAFRGKRRDGSYLSMDCLLASVELDGKRSAIAFIRDLTFDRELLSQLRESKDHYSALTETITEAILRVDESFTILFANSGVRATFGWTREELVGSNLAKLFPEEVFRQNQGEFLKYFYVDDGDREAMGLARTIELLGLTKHRGIAPMEISFGNSKDFAVRTLTCIIRELSQQKTTERRLHHLAYHDRLTGLGNRDLFNEDVRPALMEGGIPSSSALLFMDLDGFKHINDTMGHPAGDELLVEAARRIRYCLRESDVAYRFGGDEFVVWLPTVGGTRDAGLVGERILRSLRKPFELKSGSAGKARVVVTVSIGAAILPDHGRTVEEATKSADIAMYCSKEAGKNRLTIFNDSLSMKSTREWRLEQEMRQGLVKGEFEMHYQPIVDRDGDILGLEALARWYRDGEVVLPPSEFIPGAEENGVIVPLGAWVMRRAFADFRRLEERGFKDLYLSVNVSAHQLELPDFVSGLTDAIDTGGIDASKVKLEITETTLLRSQAVAGSAFHEIKERFPGIMIAIDDFGTGYSSLSYLSRLPVDTLKIDISFVRALDREQDRKVVNAILTLAESLGLNVVAEGIETNEQLDYFRERRCKGMQGHLFMEALPIGELEARLLALKPARGGRRRARPREVRGTGQRTA